MTYTATVVTRLTDNGDVLQPSNTALSAVVQSTTSFTDPGLFVFAIDPTTTAITYSHVAAPYELTSLPYNTLDLQLLFVRKSSAVIVYPSSVLADEGRTKILEAITSLCEQMDFLTTYAAAVTTVVP